MLARSALALVLVIASFRSAAQTPQISALWPPGAQRGASATVRIEGSGLQSASGVLVSGKGVAARIGTPGPVSATVSVTLTVAPDADAGPHEVRVVTPRGISTPGYLWVGALPLTAEEGANDRPQRAMRLGKLPAEICGRIAAAAGVDWFTFQAAAGDTFVMDITAVRIYSRIDPVLELRDAAGHLLANAASGYKRDPRIIYTCKSAGTYRVQVRDTMYRGGPGYVYLLSVGKLPAVTSVFPPGGRAGDTLTLHLEGANLGGMAVWTVELPAGTQPDGEWYSMPITPNGPALPVRLSVDELPQRPGASSAGRDSPQRIVELPAAVSGRILKQGQADSYLVHGTLGKPITIAVRAREFGSALDASLRVLDPAGKELANTDDQAGRDPSLTFSPPMTGDYRVQVSSVEDRGGPACFYMVRLEPAGFRLTATPDMLNLGRGQTAAIRITAARIGGFDGEIAVSMRDLAAGFVASPLTLAPGENTGIMTVTAAPSAAGGAVSLQIVGEAAVNGTTVRRPALPIAELPGPGEDTPMPRPVAFQMAAVTDSAPLFTLGAEPAGVSLTPGQSVTITVRVVRQAGISAAQGEISLSLTELPAGVSAETPAVPEKKGEVVIKLTAAADARPAARSALLTGRLGDIAQVAPAIHVAVRAR